MYLIALLLMAFAIGELVRVYIAAGDGVILDDGDGGLLSDGDGAVATTGGACGDCCASCPGGDPDLSATLTWTDTATTKNWAGKTWTNGQTQPLCPGAYSCTQFRCNTGFTTSFSARERWNLSYTPTIGTLGFVHDHGFYLPVSPVFNTSRHTQHFRFQGIGTGATSVKQYRQWNIKRTATLFSVTLTDNTNSTNKNIASGGPGSPRAIFSAPTRTPDVTSINAWWGAVTDTNGVTYSWSQGTGWGCHFTCP